MKSNVFLASLCAALVSGAPSGLDTNHCAQSCSKDFDDSCDPSMLSNALSCISSSNCVDSDKIKFFDKITKACEEEKAHITAAPQPTPTEHWDLKRAWGPYQGGGPGPGASWSGTVWPTPGASWDGKVWPTPGASWDGKVWPTTGSWSVNGPWGTWTGSGPWPTTVPNANGGPGYGPFGGNWGPWGSTGSWTASPFTSWWGDKNCPDGTWSGWTAGPWSTNAPWTSWSKGCTATTTASSTYTTMVSGSIVTDTSYGVKVAEATGATPTPTNGGVNNVVATAASTTSQSDASPSIPDRKMMIVLLSVGIAFARLF
ncbi:hypothetical protein HYFRA_00000220 [Hymenoscyphus fraxineus]|uniref:Extracellular membrane protein CFEM domain-containing protein n=1 Tax=Hymenoscyphus fraxineus TaxID=746836 RepID=A0A9N9L0H2_9HELO|nr:hypothetical protein HYFRA_00000220 [Hymenoscyphus fraxineus]